MVEESEMSIIFISMNDMGNSSKILLDELIGNTIAWQQFHAGRSRNERCFMFHPM
jgi:hypothetical protein